MSELSVGQLKGLTANNNVISVPSGHTLYAPGSVVQVQTVRSDARVTFASNASGSATGITQLNLTITPKFANSRLIIQWMINADVNENNIFVIHKNGSLITTAGEAGYNLEAGNNRWSGVVSAIYDTDVLSTLENYFIQYSCVSGSTETQTFAPAIKGSSPTNYTLFFNRTGAQLGQDNYENTISTGIIWEIAQ